MLQLHSFLKFCVSLVWLVHIPSTNARPIRLSRKQDFAASLQLLDYDSDTFSAKFLLPIDPGSPDGHEQAPFIIELHAQNYIKDVLEYVYINKDIVPISACTSKECQAQHISAEDTDGIVHDVAISAFTPDGDDHESNSNSNGASARYIRFALQSVDGVSTSSTGFSLFVAHDPRPHFQHLVLFPHGSMVNLNSTPIQRTKSHSPTPPWQQSPLPDDFVADAEALIELEAQVQTLSKSIAQRQQSIAQFLAEHRNQITLRDYISACQSLSCAAKVIAQRLCDKIGIVSNPKLGYYKISAEPRLQSPFASESVEAQKSVLEQNDGLLMMLNQNEYTGEYTFVQLVNPGGFFLGSLQIFVISLGLILILVIVSRLRRTLRALRANRTKSQPRRCNDQTSIRAVHQSICHWRFISFLARFRRTSCHVSNSRNRCNEKQALILEHAFLEDIDNIDQAEKGQIMEAEIRELRNAHDLVANLIRVDNGRPNLVHDPPPSLVPLPFTPLNRSRASTQTLPPYTSEVLPGYASGTDDSESSVGSLFPLLERSLSELEHDYFAHGSMDNSPIGRGLAC